MTQYIFDVDTRSKLIGVHMSEETDKKDRGDSCKGEKLIAIKAIIGNP
jgi:hypothetical protein